MKIIKSKLKVIIIVFTILILSIGFFFYHNMPKTATATWWNDSWSYRQSIQVTNNTSTETNVYIIVTLNTDTASTSMQTDCGDFRFTRENGEVLQYYIVSGCQTDTNVIHINFETFEAGEQLIYFYYGNPSAENGFSASDFTSEASDYTIGAVGAEETGPGPVGYWSFDDGYGTTAHDESGQGNDGTITGATWKDESECVSGKCLWFDGSNDLVSISNTINDVKTVNFWVKSTSTTASFVDLNGSAYINSINGVVGTTGFTSPTVYINAQVNTTFTSNTWQMITIVTDTAITASSLNIGKIASDYLGAYIDEVKIYPYARTADQIKQDYNAGLSGVKSNSGVAVAFGGSSDKWLTDGLVGYWKMDETATTSGAIDSSGNGNDGVYYGNASTTGGKFGNGGVFDGAGDYVGITDDDATLDFVNTNVYTWSVWIKYDSFPVDKQCYLSKDPFIDAKNTGFIFCLNNYTYGGDIVVCKMLDGSGLNCSVGVDAKIATSSWENITIVYNSDSQWEVYKNGIFLGEQIFLVDSDTNADYYIGAGIEFITFSQLPDYYFDGQIDEVRIYNRALSKSEVRKLYEWAPGPVLHLKMDEMSGTTTYDSSGNGNDATLTNMDLSTAWVFGKYGTALYFDGDNDYVSVSHKESLDLRTNFTLSSWVKLGDYSHYNSAISKGPYALKINPDRKAYFEIVDGTETITDRGMTSGTIVNGMAVHNNELYAGVYGYVYKYNKESDSWESLGTPDFNNRHEYSLISFNGNLYLGSDSFARVFRYDGGTTWTKIVDFSIDGYADVHRLIIYNNELYADVQKNYLYKRNTDTSWTKITTNSLNNLNALLSFQGNLYYNSAGSVYAYNNNNGWLGSIGAVGFASIIYTLVEYNNNLYAGTNDSGKVFRYDGGTTWTEVGDLGSESAIYAIVVYGGKLYAGGDTGNIYRYNGGTSWTTIGQPSTNTFIKSMEVYDGKLFIGSFGDGRVYSIGNGKAVYASTSIPIDSFTHLEATYDGTDMNLYIDGILSSTENISINVATSTNDMYIGGSHGIARGGYSCPESDKFRGIIDDVRIYNYARTQKQILEDMVGSGSAVKSPVVHLNFDKGYGETVHDSSIYGNNGTAYVGTGGTQTATSSMWEKSGRIKGGMELDGTDDYVAIPDFDY